MRRSTGSGSPDAILGSLNEVLQQLRLAGGGACRRAQPAALGLRPPRRDPLPESAPGRRLDPGVRGQGSSLPSRDRAALRLLDAARGVMENDETTAQAALRETLEEAGARVELDAPFSMISVPRVNQVHVFYRARVLDSASSPARKASRSRCGKRRRFRGRRSRSAPSA